MVVVGCLAGVVVGEGHYCTPPVPQPQPRVAFASTDYSRTPFVVTALDCHRAPAQGPPSSVVLVLLPWACGRWQLVGVHVAAVVGVVVGVVLGHVAAVGAEVAERWPRLPLGAEHH